MDNYIDFYFKNGCTECGGEVELFIDTFTYKCKECKACASAHRKDTDHSKKYEPYQYLASTEINELRHTLEKLFNQLWQKKVPFTRDDSLPVTNQPLINIIFPFNVRGYGEDDIVKVIRSKKSVGTCDVIDLNTNKVIEDVIYLELKTISSRDKSHAWLAGELGIKVTECRIGYLSESQLKNAIETCSKNLKDARSKAVANTEG